MDDAELYSVYNSMQRQATESVLEEFSPRLSWGEKERVLDVGCGPGDVTVKVLLPLLPRSATLVGVDLSATMVDFANKNHSSTRVHFKTLDFGTENIRQVFEAEQFTKIFSFYCFHWIQDQHQVAKNIKILLRPGGQFLFVIAPKNQVFKVHRIMSLMDEWKIYMEDVDKYIPSLNSSVDPCQEIRNIFKKQGLEVMQCEERRETVTFPSMEVLLRSNEAVNPFVNRMSQETRSQYIECFKHVIEENNMVTETDSGKIHTMNPFIVVQGRRPM